MTTLNESILNSLASVSTFVIAVLMSVGTIALLF